MIEFVQAMPVVRTFDAGFAAFVRYQQALASLLGSANSMVLSGRFFCAIRFRGVESSTNLVGIAVGGIRVTEG
ncbi:MAG: hypothetical protein ACSLEN_11140 [Candidatus Malihini olakiniferum]